MATNVFIQGVLDIGPEGSEHHRDTLQSVYSLRCTRIWGGQKSCLLLLKQRIELQDSLLVSHGRWNGHEVVVVSPFAFFGQRRELTGSLA